MAEEAPETSVKGAALSVLDLSHRLLLDRIALLRLEAKEDLYGALRATAFATAAAILIFYGWLFLAALVVYGLQLALPLAVTLGMVAAFHLIVGALLAWWGARAFASIRFMEPDDDAAWRRERDVASRLVTGAR